MSCRSPLTVPIATPPLDLHVGVDQVRAQQLERGLHRVGADEHLGHEDLAFLEQLADVAHRRHQPVLQQLSTAPPSDRPFIGGATASAASPSTTASLSSCTSHVCLLRCGTRLSTPEFA